ncbi:MAG TPA: hypothetical protein VGL56_14685 [Fimbriimonadaceae bacterium]|jgi:hypothetical protein
MKSQRRRFGSWPALICALALALHSPAQETHHKPLLDAKTAIAEIEGNDPETKIENAEISFVKHMNSFSERSPKMRPQDAAAEWLAIVDEAVAIPHRSFRGGLGGAGPGPPIGSLSTVMTVLPPPETWPYLQALVEKRPASKDNTALRMLCARLLGQDSALISLCKQYDGESAADSRGSNGSQTEDIRIAAQQRLGKLTALDVIHQVATENNARQIFPRFLDILDRETAEKLLVEYLSGKDIDASMENEQNRKLAQEVVLAHLNQIPKPQWLLAEDMSDLPYVKQLVLHYGQDKLLAANGNGGPAQEIYFRGLLQSGRVDEAVKITEDVDFNRIDPSSFISASPVLFHSVNDLLQRLPRKICGNSMPMLPLPPAILRKR